MGRTKKVDLRQFVDSAPIRMFCMGVGAGGWAIGAKQACPVTVVGAWEDDAVARRLFTKNSGPALPPGGKQPHYDLVTIADERKEWARDYVLEARPRMVCMERKLKKDWLSGYNCYRESLCTSEFGLSQKRKREFLVAFRDDINPKFSYFPFPDPVHGYYKATEPTLTKGSKVSIPEAIGLMGYPEGLETPDSKTATLQLLSGDVSVPVARAIIEEIWTWVS
jgi:site-specific DNA-cytosine methylase